LETGRRRNVNTSVDRGETCKIKREEEIIQSIPRIDHVPRPSSVLDKRGKHIL
jgi:hypothetical protein